MKLSFRHGIAVAVGAGLLATGVAACGSDNSTGADEIGSEVATSDIQGSGGTLTCDDLAGQMGSNPHTDVDELSPDELRTLAAWMVDNGHSFDDNALGRAVTEWGELGPDYYRIDGESLPDVEASYFEAASENIDESCPGLGFAP